MKGVLFSDSLIRVGLFGKGHLSRDLNEVSEACRYLKEYFRQRQGQVQRA